MRQQTKKVKKTVISISISQVIFALILIISETIHPNFNMKMTDIYVLNESNIFYVYHSGRSYIDIVDPKGEKCLIPWRYTKNITKAKLIMYNPFDNLNEITGSRDKKLRPDQATCIESMESASNYPIIIRYMRNFNYTMFYALTSDVPIPYSQYFKSNEPPLPLEKKRGHLAAAFVSNCYANNKRTEYLEELMKYMKVDSYGRCLNNAKIPIKWQSKSRDATKEKVISHYKFTLAFENSNDFDYITEKFYQPLRYGSVPIFRGCKNVEDFAPPNSFIDANKFSSPKKLAEYINYLDTHDDEYNKYLEWKKTNNLGNLAKILFFRDRHESGVCALIERMHGLWLNPFLTDWKRTTKSYAACNKCQRDFNMSLKRIPVLKDNGSKYDYPLNEYWINILGNKTVNNFVKNNEKERMIKMPSKSGINRFKDCFFIIFLTFCLIYFII